MQEGITRREFLRASAAAATSFSLFSNMNLLFAQDAPPDIAVAQNGEPQVLVRKAVEALGGISKFVKKGDNVLIKPNMGFNRKPEYAATTNPELLAQVIKMCLDAGAKQVRVIDRTCDNERQCAANTGIKRATEDTGGTFEFVNMARFVEKEVKEAIKLKKWDFYRDALEADCIINIAIAKQHGLAGLTMCIKNWMGLIGGKRQDCHRHLSENLVDMCRVFKSNARLFILDGYRILVKGGPQGGNLKNVKEMKTVIASSDIVACDAYGTTLFDKKPEDIKYIPLAAREGIGRMDIDKMNVKVIDASK